MDLNGSYMKTKHNISLILITSLLLFLASCAQDGDDSFFGIDSGDLNDEASSLQSVNFSTSCGVVSNALLTNPVTQAELVSVQAVNTDLVIVTRMSGDQAGNQQLISLHGLDSDGISDSRRQEGVNFISESASFNAFLVVADPACSVRVDGGGLGVAGQLFLTNGVSVNEELLTRGLAFSSGGSECGANLLSSCYSTLEAQAPAEVFTAPVVPIADNNINDSFSSGSNPPCSSLAFGDGRGGDLWLAESESNGRPVYLLNSGWQAPASVQAELTSGGFTDAEFTGFANPDADGRLRPHFRFSRDCTELTGRLVVRDANQTCNITLPGDVCSRID